MKTLPRGTARALRLLPRTSLTVRLLLPALSAVVVLIVLQGAATTVCAAGLSSAVGNAAHPAHSAGTEWRVPSREAPTLAAALAHAAEGDRIVLAPGVYRERVVVEKSVSISAAVRGGPGAAVPGGHGSDWAVLDGEGAGRVLEIVAPGVSVTGLHIRASGDLLEKTDACIYAREVARGTVLRGNMLTDCAFGIWINGAPDVVIEDNLIEGRPRPIFSDRGNGINLWQISAGLVRGNVISQVRDGINLSVSKDSRVEDNRMSDLRFGIHYMYADHNVVIGNETRDSQVGFAIMFSKRLEIRDNRAINNRDYGILFRSIYDSKITGNLVQGNAKGLFINDASFNEIKHNTLQGNAIGAHLTGGSGENQVVGNNFVNNQVQVRFSWRHPQYWDTARSERLDSDPSEPHPPEEGNYWSDYLGWDLDKDGIGDRPHFTSSTMDQLVYRYPSVKVLATSPVVLLLQALEARFPVLRPAGVIDRRPALHPFQEAPIAADAASPTQVAKRTDASAAARPRN